MKAPIQSMSPKKNQFSFFIISDSDNPNLQFPVPAPLNTPSTGSFRKNGKLYMLITKGLGCPLEA